MNVLLEMLPCFENRLIRLLLEARNLHTKGVGLAHQEEFLEERIGASILGGGFLMVGVEPLLHLPEQREREEAKADGVRRHPFDGEGATHLHEVLQVCIGSFPSVF